VTNRSAEAVEVDVAHVGAGLELAEGWQMRADHEPAVAGPEHAEKVLAGCWSPVDVSSAVSAVVSANGGTTTLRLAPESWTALTGTLQGA
jgi:alpha-N-arabinofuranosidase